MYADGEIAAETFGALEDYGISSAGKNLRGADAPRALSGASPASARPSDRALSGARIVALTGRRGVGKTTAAEHLVQRHGFRRVHPFAGGKAMAEAWFRHLGHAPDVADAMVHGVLRDRPSPLLPGGATPRHFLERFGRFMGQEMGQEWTLGTELDLAERATPGRALVIESLVYEAEAVRARGGLVVRIERAASTLRGECTDDAQAAIAADATIRNDGSLVDLHRALDALVKG